VTKVVGNDKFRFLTSAYLVSIKRDNSNYPSKTTSWRRGWSVRIPSVYCKFAVLLQTK